MKIFIAHANEQRDLFEGLKTRLRAAGHSVFDPSSLPKSQGYDERIRDEIRSSDLMVFMASAASVQKDHFARNELQWAEECWPNPTNHVLGVVVDETSSEQIPPYVRGVTMLRPQGNIEAAVVSAIADIRPGPYPGMSRVAQFGLYAALFLAVLSNLMSPSMIRGELYIKSGKDNAPAKDYILSTGSDQFTVNKNGRWVLRSQKRLPGTVAVTLTDPSGTKKLDEMSVPLPWPLVGSMMDDQIRITYDADIGDSKVVSNYHVPSDILVATVAAAQPPAGLSQHRAPGFTYVRIAHLAIKEAGDGGSNKAELFFQILVDGKEVQPLGFPSRQYRGTHLLIGNNTSTEFPDLGFRIPRNPSGSPSHVELLLYDWDPCILCANNPDDLVGRFRFEVGDARIGRTLELATSNDLDPDHVYPPDNSIIRINFVAE